MISIETHAAERKTRSKNLGSGRVATPRWRVDCFV
jgi:hypothetical protein